jgi:cation diffusion facilitator family transporter
MSSCSSRRVIYAALLGNLLVALTKFGAAASTGSSAMLSEAIHSLVDTGNELLLLYGLRRASRPADERHPLGHGRELYFWSFIVALLVFALGAGVSVYEGVSHILHPVPITNPLVNTIVIGLALVFEGGSWWVALQEFRAAKGELGYLAAVRQSKDPPSFMVLFEDSAALFGLLIALAGTAAAEMLRRPVLDGVASIAIGVLLGVVAFFLARETKGLLIGEGARSEILASICAMARGMPGIEQSNGLMTIHLGPRQIVAMLSVDFANEISAGEVEAIVAALEERVRKQYPEIVILLIKPQSAAEFQRSRARRFQTDGRPPDGCRGS